MRIFNYIIFMVFFACTSSSFACALDERSADAALTQSPSAPSLPEAPKPSDNGAPKETQLNFSLIKTASAQEQWIVIDSLFGVVAWGDVFTLLEARDIIPFVSRTSRILQRAFQCELNDKIWEHVSYNNHTRFLRNFADPTPKPDIPPPQSNGFVSNVTGIVTQTVGLMSYAVDWVTNATPSATPVEMSTNWLQLYGWWFLKHHAPKHTKGSPPCINHAVQQLVSRLPKLAPAFDFSLMGENKHPLHETAATGDRAAQLLCANAYIDFYPTYPFGSKEGNYGDLMALWVLEADADADNGELFHHALTNWQRAFREQDYPALVNTVFHRRSKYLADSHTLDRQEKERKLFMLFADQAMDIFHAPTYSSANPVATPVMDAYYALWVNLSTLHSQLDIGDPDRAMCQYYMLQMCRNDKLPYLINNFINEKPVDNVHANQQKLPGDFVLLLQHYDSNKLKAHNPFVRKVYDEINLLPAFADKTSLTQQWHQHQARVVWAHLKEFGIEESSVQELLNVFPDKPKAHANVFQFVRKRLHEKYLDPNTPRHNRIPFYLLHLCAMAPEDLSEHVIPLLQSEPPEK